MCGRMMKEKLQLRTEAAWKEVLGAGDEETKERCLEGR